MRSRPGASIVLIECDSSSIGALLQGGAKTAAGLPGVSVVSMSFGTLEFGGESYYDSNLTTPSGHQGVTFVASTGDSGARRIPCVFAQRRGRGRHQPHAQRRQFLQERSRLVLQRRRHQFV